MDKPFNKKLLEKTAKFFEGKIKDSYKKGFGIFPATEPKEVFYNQLWTRDFAQAAMSHFSVEIPQATRDSLEVIFRNQRSDGMLPLRVEKNYLILRLVPGLKPLSNPIFNLIRGGRERAIYEGGDFSSAEDTVPAAILAAAHLASVSDSGKEFIRNNYIKLKKAVEFFETKVDSSDGLAVLEKNNADWEDSVVRGGKLGSINIWWAKALEAMSMIAKEMGEDKDFAEYSRKFEKTKKSVMEKLYNSEENYFRAKEGEDRLDTTACIFGCLYFLTAEECAKVQETMKGRVSNPSGLKNFDPPYSYWQTMLPHKFIKMEGYHNYYIWPWITCQNIGVKVKIALEHKDSVEREKYRNEAVSDLFDMTKMFKESDGAYEIYKPDNRRAGIKTFYKPPRYFMANLAAYLYAYNKLKQQDWI